MVEAVKVGRGVQESRVLATVAALLKVTLAAVAVVLVLLVLMLHHLSVGLVVMVLVAV